MVTECSLDDLPEFDDLLDIILIPILQKEAQGLQQSLLVLRLAQLPIFGARLHQQILHNKHQIPDQTLLVLTLNVSLLLNSCIDSDLA